MSIIPALIAIKIGQDNLNKFRRIASSKEENNKESNGNNE